MCMVCGCPPKDYGDCHGDIRKVTTLNLTGSADATGLPLKTICANLADSMNKMLAESDDDATKSLRINITLEPM